jgi:hypothetical protein
MMDADNREVQGSIMAMLDAASGGLANLSA